MKGRYKFYREHKYVSAAVNDVERLIAKTDFRNVEAVASTYQQFEELVAMLNGHADYENSCLHPLLKAKGSHVFQHAEEDHALYDALLDELQNKFKATMQEAKSDERIELGYELYLLFRKFAGKNLEHLHEEESIILPELQRLYSDEELKQVEKKTYKIMTAEQLVEMMQVLFTYMNPSDKMAFLEDIKEAEPEKFRIARQEIESQLTPTEKQDFLRFFQAPC